MRYIIWGLRLLIFILVLLFAVKNTAPVSVNLYGDAVLSAVPLIIVLLLAFALGALCMYILTLPTRYRCGREISRLKGEVKRLQSDSNIITTQQQTTQRASDQLAATVPVPPDGFVPVKSDQPLLK